MGQVLGQMRFEIGVDYSKMTSSLGKANQAVRYATAEMKANMAALGPAAKQVDLLSTKQAGLTKQMQAQATAASRLAKSYQGSLVNGEPGKQSARLATQLQNANTKLAQLNNEFINNARAVAKAKVETTGITGAMNRVGKTSISVGTKMSSMGSTVTSKVTTPIVAGLGLAVKSAIDFDSQISSMGPLLTNGGAVTAKYRKELEQLGNGSKTWAKQYGISTTVINDAMSELIKRGFTAQQTLGAMPSIMDASVASGEDLGTVMQATASIMEQFGLKGRTTAETLTNTQRVTDSLTYAANATASGFGDMSEAMSYVGPVAKSVGMSVEDTAAAIGVLSNQGIEGEKAGTNLRGILTALVNPSKNAAGALKKMGISSKQAKEDASDLPKLIDDIKNGTKNWTAADKAQALAQVFGKQNQAAMNSLLAAGSGELRELTKNTESATGATKKIAEQMSATKANQIKRTVENIKQMGITIGQKLLPLLPPVLKNINGMVDAFGKLDSGTQQNIIKWVALAAAMGPILSIGGKTLTMFGRMNTGIVGLVSKVSQWRAGTIAAKEANAILSGSAEAVGQTMTKSGSSMGIASKAASFLGGKFLATGEAAGVLGTALTPLGAGVVAATLAVGAGVAVWELWGKNAVQSAQRTQRWGSDVGKTADESLTKFENFQKNTATALNSFGNNANDNAKKAAQRFKDMASEITESGKKSTDALDKSLKGLPQNIANIVKEGAADRKAQINEAVSDAQSLSSKITKIQQKASSEKRSLTAEEKQFMLNSQRQMNADEINSLNISNSQKKLALKALNSDVLNMSKQQQTEVEGTLVNSLKTQYDKYQQQSTKLKGLWKSGAIDTLTYQDAINQLDKNYSAATDNMAGSMYKLMVSQGKDIATITMTLAQFGISYDQAKQAAENMSTSSSKSLSMVADTASKMSGESRKAGQAWNDIVLDPKTGEVKTNLQETLNDTAKTNEGWSSMIFAVKHAKIDSNAKAMVGIAAIQNGIWDNLTWQDKKAMIASNAGDTIVKSLTANGTWNKMTFAQKSAILQAKGGPEVADIIAKAGLWNKLSLQDKKALVATSGTKGLIDTLDKFGVWNQLSPKDQQAIVQTKGASALADVVLEYGAWNNLPQKTKNILIKDDDARQKLINAGVLTDTYNQKNIVKKTVRAENTDFMSKLKSGNDAINNLNNKKVLTKNLKGNASNIQNAARASVTAQNSHNTKKVNTKNLKGNASSVVNSAGQSTAAVSRHNAKSVSTKQLKGNASNVITNTNNGLTKLSQFNGKGVSTKNLKANDNASGPAGRASGAVDAFSRKKGHTVTLVTKLQTIVEKIFKGKKALGSQNFEGGLAIVNDQTGATFRERIDYPDGTSEIPTGRNVVRYIPKHSRIIPARMTARMHPGLPQFANGLNIPDNAEILTATEIASRSISQSNITVNTPTQDNSLIIDQLGKMISLLSSLVSKDSNVYLDQQKIAQLLDNQNGSNISLRERGVRI